GLYYAIRSGDLASQAVLVDQDLKAKAESYRRLIAEDFGLDLTYGAHLAKEFFHRTMFFHSVPSWMVYLVRRSPAFREIMQGLFAGTQPYRDLKSLVRRNLARTLGEVAQSFVRSAVVDPV
ncbi:MAG: hypothetical protein JOZ48_07915, partial [Acidobacteriaceae bacterium]|nr:hypothetical protein [Acidobacteriaceae bacterium]